VYGYSKLLFDQYVRRLLPERGAQVAGFRYFNVYGPREAHKGRMASVVWHFFNEYRRDGKVRPFEGSDGYAAGEQRRDFISVEDVVRVNLDFLDHPQRSGREADRQEPLPFAELHRTGAVEYIGFPPALRGKYQSFTQADISRLRAADYTAPMLSVEDGVRGCVRALLASPASKP